MQKRSAPRRVLDKLLPVREPSCPHQLARWLVQTHKTTATYPDGNTRPNRLRGGRLVRTATGCIGGAGHAGSHLADDGRHWT